MSSSFPERTPNQDAEREISRVQIEQLEDVIKRQTLELENQRQFLIDYQTALSSKETELETAESRIKHMRSLAEDAVKSYSDINSNLFECKKKREALQERFSELERSSSDAIKENEVLVLKVRELEEKIETISDQLFVEYEKGEELMRQNQRAKIDCTIKLNDKIRSLTEQNLLQPITKNRVQTLPMSSSIIPFPFPSPSPSPLPEPADIEPTPIPRATYVHDPKHMKLHREPDRDPEAEMHREAVKEVR